MYKPKSFLFNCQYSICYSCGQVDREHKGITFCQGNTILKEYVTIVV